MLVPGIKMLMGGLLPRTEGVSVSIFLVVIPFMDKLAIPHQDVSCSFRQ